MLQMDHIILNIVVSET